MELAELAGFFGWMVVINVALFSATFVAMLVARAPIARLHARLMGLEAGQLPLLYFRYLAHFKLAIIVLSITPYLALRIMLG